MTRPYSTDLRERVVRAVEAGASRRSLAAQFEASVSFVTKLTQRWRRRGTVRADLHRNDAGRRARGEGQNALPWHPAAHDDSSTAIKPNKTAAVLTR